MNKKKLLHFMTWKEVEEAFKDNPVVIVPMGSMEEHGPHSITGDYIAAQEIAERIASESEAYCTPVIPFGYSEYFRGFPGTISFSPETVYKVSWDICQSLIEHGIKKIFLVNGHAGNSSILDQLARDIKRRHRIMVVKIDLWQSLSNEFKSELYGDQNPMGHGGEPITSVMHYLMPECMRMDLIEDQMVEKKWQNFELSGISKAKIKDIDVSIYMEMNEITEEGILGDPYIGSSITGEKIVNRLVEYGKEVVNLLNNSDTEDIKLKLNE